MREVKHAPFISPSSFFYNKKIRFKKKVVSNVASETTFFLKSIFLREKERQRKDEGYISNISPNYKSRRSGEFYIFY
jgi:hypothetical protein